MNPRPLQVFCDDKVHTWSLSLDMTGAVVRAFRLSQAPLSLRGARSGRIVAEIREPRQIDAVIARVADDAVPPSELAQELMDLLVTLAADRPGEECLDFLRWRLCEWIVENRRRPYRGQHVA